MYLTHERIAELIEVRKFKGLTQKELSELMNVSQTVVSQLENFKRKIPVIVERKYEHCILNFADPLETK